MSENVKNPINMDKELSYLKELALYSQEILLIGIKSALEGTSEIEKITTLGMCGAIISDWINLVAKLHPTDPQFRLQSLETMQFLRGEHNYFNKSRKQFEVIDKLNLKLKTVRDQLNERDGLITTMEKDREGFLDKLADTPVTRPPIVVLCGSTRFVDTYDQKSLEFTLDGWIVLSVGSHKKSDKNLSAPDYSVVGDVNIAANKSKLDELHLRKIDLADLVYIINRNSYIGSSTSKEIRYAEKLAKKIEYMEPTGMRTVGFTEDPEAEHNHPLDLDNDQQQDINCPACPGYIEPSISLNSNLFCVTCNYRIAAENMTHARHLTRELDGISPAGDRVRELCINCGEMKKYNPHTDSYVCYPCEG